MAKWTISRAMVLRIMDKLKADDTARYHYVAFDLAVELLREEDVARPTEHVDDLISDLHAIFNEGGKRATEAAIIAMSLGKSAAHELQTIRTEVSNFRGAMSNFMDRECVVSNDSPKSVRLRE